MRPLITCTNLIFIIAVIILIHSSILSRNMRENEVQNALEASAEYGLDVLSEQSVNIATNEEWNEESITEMMQIFCNAVATRIGTNGDVTVMLQEADPELGVYSFIIKEEFSYPYGNRKGVCYVNKVYRTKQL